MAPMTGRKASYQADNALVRSETQHCRKWCRVEILKKVILIQVLERTILNSCVAFGQLSSSFKQPCASQKKKKKETDIQTDRQTDRDRETE